MDSDECASRGRAEGQKVVKPTDVADPEYFHKVVDCQWACPAHTPVPEDIRKIAAGDYNAAYMINWELKVFPGILGRTCDRPCEPACRRGRLEEQPVAICRLKRVAADHKQDIAALLPPPPADATAGASPASARAGVADGGARSRRDRLRGRGVRFRFARRRHDAQPDSQVSPPRRGDRRGGRLRPLHRRPVRGRTAHRQSQGPRQRRLRCDFRRLRRAARTQPGDSRDAGKPPGHIHIGIDWLASVSFGHVSSIGRRVVVLGGGNTAMDCCRTARRLGGAEVKVVVRSGFAEMKASPWEKEHAMREGVAILNFHRAQGVRA